MACVLVVSSQDKFVKVLTGRLIKAGYAAIMAENSTEALELIEWMFFTVALLDFSASDSGPSMMEVAQALRESDAMLPIIAMPLSPQDPRCAQLTELRLAMIFSPVDLGDLLQVAEDLVQPDPDA